MNKPTIEVIQIRHITDEDVLRSQRKKKIPPKEWRSIAVDAHQDRGILLERLEQKTEFIKHIIALDVPLDVWVAEKENRIKELERKLEQVKGLQKILHDGVCYCAKHGVQQRSDGIKWALKKLQAIIDGDI